MRMNRLEAGLSKTLRPTVVLVLFVLVAIGLASCGRTASRAGGQSRSKSNTKTATGRASVDVTSTESCSTIIGDEERFQQDAGELAKTAQNVAVSGKAVADLENLKVAVEQIEPDADSTQTPVLEQYTSVLDQLVGAIKTAVTGNLSSAVGQVTGASQQFNQLTPQVNHICADEASTASGSSTTATVTAPKTVSASPSVVSCGQALISRSARECSFNGVTVPLVFDHGVLRLNALDAQVVDVREEASVSNLGISATAHGVFVIVTLKVSNTSSIPQAFDGLAANETVLGVNGDVYSEAFNAENQADQQAFLTESNSVEPGESVTGDVIFDVPKARASSLLSSPASVLLVGDFGVDMDTATDGFGIISLEGA